MPYLADMRVPDPEDRSDRKLISDIHHYGWHVLGISPDPGHDAPPYAFSVGLYYSLGHPEVVITGLPHERAQSIVNVIGQRVSSVGPYAPDTPYSDVVEGYDVVMRTIPRSTYSEYLGSAMWFYRAIGADFPALQVFWPDRHGRFPWQPGFDEHLARLQFPIANAA